MILVLDTETTGLPTRWNANYSDLDVWPRIVTISWSIYRSKSEMLKHHHCIVKPSGFYIPLDSTRIHGISNDRAQREGLQLTNVLATLLQDVHSFHTSLLVCHNVDFDRPIVLAEMLRSGVDRSDIVSFESLPTYCTMRSTTDFCALPGGPRGYKFPTLDQLYYKLFSRSLKGAHNSANDAQACAECYFQFIATSRTIISTSSNSLASHTSRCDDDDDDGEAQELLDTIYAFAADHPEFDTDFVDSLQSQLDDRGYLTPGQIAAARKIIARWHMD